MSCRDINSNSCYSNRTSSWLSKFSFVDSNNGETCHLKSGYNYRIGDDIPCDSDMHRKSTVILNFLIIFVLCVIIIGLGLLVYNIYWDYNTMVKLNRAGLLHKIKHFDVDPQIQSPKKVCSLCFACLDNCNDTVRLNCGHEFHKDCLVTWLQNQNTCPVCSALGATLSPPCDHDFVVQQVIPVPIDDIGPVQPADQADQNDQK